MAGKKRVPPKSVQLYKLRINHFTKSYDSSRHGPKARSGHRIVCNEKYMFSIGGFNPQTQNSFTQVDTSVDGGYEGTVFHEVWRFDFDMKTWKKLKTDNMPKELASCATALSGNLLFLYGGTGNPFGVKINDKVFVCNLQAPNSLMQFNAIDTVGLTKPLKQYGQSIAIDESYLYTVGGTNGFVYSMDIYRLDLRTSVWEKLTNNVIDATEPSPRYRQEIVIYNDYLVVFGGGTSTIAFSLEKIPAFNLKKHRWEIFQTVGDESLNYEYPQKRRCHACVQDPYNPAIVFVNGGVNEIQMFNDTWKLDLLTLRWTCVKSLILPYGIHFHSAAPTPDGKMVIFGGVTRSSVCSGEGVRTADVFTAWITVPKLKYACWDAVMHYIRNGVIQVPKDSNKLGLPPEYEARLKNCL